MDGSYRFDGSTIPLANGGRLSHLLRLRDQAMDKVREHVPVVSLTEVKLRGAALRRALLAAPGRTRPYLAHLGPWMRAHLHFFGVTITADDEAEPSPAELILMAFDGLTETQKACVARNVALLWDCFTEQFNGISGFCQVPETQQSAYLGKLKEAAARMGSSTIPEARYHFVSVALMWHYVASFQSNSTDPGAIALSRRVAALIDGTRSEVLTPA
jgi:hypothetical protein